MRWIREHVKLTIVIVVIVAMTILMTTSYFVDYTNFFVSTGVQKAVSVAQAPLTKIGNSISGGLKGIFGFRQVLAQNEEMKQQITDLNREIIDNKLAASELEELRSLSAALNYLETIPEYSYVTADVIAQDASIWLSTFTINVGESQGVGRDDIVINGDGLIGRVASVGGSWAKVVTIIDNSGSVSFRISRSIDFTGVLEGNGEGELEGYLLDPEADIVEGDVLITSGLGGYPQGISIGKVHSVVSDDDKLLKSIRIEPNVNFSSLQKVTVIQKR